MCYSAEVTGFVFENFSSNSNIGTTATIKKNNVGEELNILYCNILRHVLKHKEVTPKPVWA
jgi:hypothetical protein